MAFTIEPSKAACQPQAAFVSQQYVSSFTNQAMMTKAKKEEDELEKSFKKIQEYLQEPPVIIWGSGATVQYGMPTMNDLKILLSRKFPEMKNSSDNLEEELGKECYAESIDKIKEDIWKAIIAENHGSLSRLINFDPKSLPRQQPNDRFFVVMADFSPAILNFLHRHQQLTHNPGHLNPGYWIPMPPTTHTT